MNCLIVDDNKVARMAIKELALQTKQLTVLGECSDGLEAYEFIQNKPVDLVLLDIEMPGMSGIDLLKSLPQRPIIIFSTAKSDYAVDAFDLNVADYIVKPVTLPRLLQALKKAQLIYNSRNISVTNIEQEYIFLKDKGTLKKISLADVLWIEAMGDYVKIFTVEKWFMVHSTLKSLEEKIPSSRFMKVHRSYVISLNKIDHIEEGLIYINNKPIPFTETYKSQLMDRLNLI